MNIQKFLYNKIQQALINIVGNSEFKLQVKQSVKTQFGDYQVNGVMTVAKQLGLSPNLLAKKIIDLLDLNHIAYQIDIASPGFINIYLNFRWLEDQITKIIFSPSLGIKKVKPQNIVVDYSAPNVAKEMHVGHMRSTIIGDASVRTLTFLGHNVIRVNHIGDWGTQFGMLIAYLEEIKSNNKLELQLSNLENFYRTAKKHYDENPDFAKRARSYVVKLQNGDEYCRKIWRYLVDITMIQNQKIYDRLNITLKHEDIMGESLYNNMLPEIVSDLKNKGLAIEKEGAIIVFLKEFKNRKGNPIGVIVQKKDGAYLYTTTDIACVKYRYEKLKADRIIYYIDSRQQQHLMQVWAIARKAGYIPKSLILEHHKFGMMLDKEGKPFKTRVSTNIKLNELLDEALKRAKYLINNKNPNINSIELEKLAQIISIGAIKYADLSKNRNTNYVFNWDNMLNFEGNSAPYIQYSYTRIISIFKRNNQNKKLTKGNIKLSSKEERLLAIKLLQFEEAITTVARDGTPHILCNYLYNLATLFSVFYEQCSILNAENDSIRQSRLKLSLLTARTLKQGLELLGIKTVEKM